MQTEIEEWILNFVSVKSKKLDAIPCPFAKKALLKKSIRYVDCNSQSLTEEFARLKDSWDDSFEVVACFANQDQFTVSELQQIVDQFNQECKDNEIDLVALEDHPKDAEIINGETMNFGKAILVLLQRASKLSEASKILKDQGYYKNWSNENYQSVVAWRDN